MPEAMRVLVTTGASGGHIFPALAFIDSLQDKYKNFETLLILPKRSLKSDIALDGYRVKYICTSPIDLRINFKNFFAIFRFFQGVIESVFIFLAFKPDIVVGFGSLDSVPLVLTAWMARVKTLIHEQNCLPGRANRLLAKFSDKVAVSFAQTEKYFGIDENKVVFTGNPIRQKLKKINRPEALGFFGLDEGKLTVLVMGGSHGSHRINICFLEAVSGMPDTAGIQIIHIAGKEDYQLLNSGYKNSGLKFRLFSFLKEMQYAYSISDLAICRGGATTMAELIFFKIPAIVIPYPFAYQHQFCNAKILQDNNCAAVINDNDLEKDKLINILGDLLHYPVKLDLMRLNYNNIARHNANDLLIEAVVSMG